MKALRHSSRRFVLDAPGMGALLPEQAGREIMADLRLSAIRGTRPVAALQ